MNTVRHYFTSDDLDDLELLEEQLEAYDVTTAQIHVLSNDETGIANHIHLHAVQSLLKNDVVHSSMIGAMCGLVGMIVILGAVYLTGLHNTNVGWLPFVFLSVVVLGFCTWEGGFIGFQQPNYHYKRFEEALNSGKHVFIVELDREHEPVLKRVLEDHPGLVDSGTEIGPPHWIFAARARFFSFIDRNLFSFSQVKS